MKAFVSKGDRVLLKPNFLLARRAERAVTTHPALILAVAREVFLAGGQITVGDSPGVGTSVAVARKLGLIEPLRDLGAEVVDLRDSVEVKAEGFFRRLELSRTALEADRIINLPKLKTHGQMSMTLAIKNMFGTVVGQRKAAWHLEAGRDRALFARVLLDIHDRTAPVLAIADGIVGMEGNGPSGGTPRRVGILAASADAPLLDQALCEIVGFPPRELPTLQAAWEGNGGPAELCHPLVNGPLPADIKVGNFRRARPSATGLLPRPLARGLRRLVEIRPEVDRQNCSGCGLCEEHCPAHSIRVPDKNARINHVDCIHCFVCQEICPEEAISPRRGIVRRLLKR